MPKKKVTFADDPEEEELIEVWDFRKIAIGIVFLVLLIFGGIIGKRILFHESIAPSSFIPKVPSVKGIFSNDDNSSNTSPHVKISLPTQQDVQNQIRTIQDQVTHLNVNDIATASPQVKQVLKQLQELPAGPVGQVKEACIRLCNNL